MLLNQCTLFIGLLLFLPWESICLVSSYTMMEMSLYNCTLMITSRNFQHISSWKLNRRPTIPIRYTVTYTTMSTNDEWKTFESCTNITKLSCNMTDIEETNETYLVNVIGFNGTEKLVECDHSFIPIMTILDPPEVSIFGFKDTINVTVHYPASLSKIKNKEKEFYSSEVIIKVQSHDALPQNLEVDMDGRESVTTIIDSLIPNSNYCISAYWNNQLSENDVIQSPLKCIMLSPSQESGSEKNIIIQFILATCLVIILLIIFVMFLKKTGYICRKKPDSLKVLDFPAVIPGPLQLSYVEVTRANIIYKTKKKKMCDDSDDKSDSDCESTLKIENNYTMNGFTCRSLSQDSNFTCKEYNSTDSYPKEPENPEVDPLPADTDSAISCQLKTGSDESRVCHIWRHHSEDSNFSSKSEDCFNFNVNLNTVFVGNPGDDEASEEDAAQILPVQEDKINLVDSDGIELKHITHATALFHVPSKEYLWSENASSDESVTSESDVNLGDGLYKKMNPDKLNLQTLRNIGFWAARWCSK